MQAVVQGCCFTDGFKLICQRRQSHPSPSPVLATGPNTSSRASSSGGLHTDTVRKQIWLKKDLLFVCLPVNLSWISWSVPDPAHHSVTKEVVKTCSNVKREIRVARISVNSSSTIKTQLHTGLNVSQLHEFSLIDTKYVHYNNHGESFIPDRCVAKLRICDIKLAQPILSKDL